MERSVQAERSTIKSGELLEDASSRAKTETQIAETHDVDLDMAVSLSLEHDSSSTSNQQATSLDDNKGAIVAETYVFSCLTSTFVLSRIELFFCFLVVTLLAVFGVY